MSHSTMFSMTDDSRSPPSAPLSAALEQGLRLIRASPVPMLILRGDNRMAAANPALAALLPEALPQAWAPLAALLPGAGAEALAARILDGSLAQASTPTLALSPVCEPDGAIVGVLGVAAASAPAADQAPGDLGLLVESGPVGVARFRAITNALPQMVWSTRADGFHDYYNDGWYGFTGVPPGSTDGEGWNDMFHPDDQDAAWVKWRHSLATGEPYEIEYRLRHRDGGYRWVLGRALPVRDGAGVIQRWMGTCTDIHEHKLTEDALREADQRKDEFLAMLGHELRNPLAPIRSAAALLPLAKADPDRVEHIGRVIARQSTHMTGLIDDLLDVSRVTRGLIALDQEDVAVRLLIDEAVEQARPLIEARNHALEIVDQLDGACVHGDRKRLVQVLANLLSNAARYTPPGGRIAVTLARVDGMVEIAVSDNGIGMAPDLVDSVFELFRQGQRTPDRSQGGLGIGLALVKRLVHLHGGRVGASSPGEGLGSEVVVALPACRQATQPEAA